MFYLEKSDKTIKILCLSLVFRPVEQLFCRKKDPQYDIIDDSTAKYGDNITTFCFKKIEDEKISKDNNLTSLKYLDMNAEKLNIPYYINCSLM